MIVYMMTVNLHNLFRFLNAVKHLISISDIKKKKKKPNISIKLPDIFR